MIQFLRQIPYFEKWKVKELLDLKEFFKVKKIDNRGQYIFREGEKCEKFIVIKNGEFEIAKTDLRNVYFNKTSGIVGVKEDNLQGTMIRSTNPINQNVTMLENSLG